MKRTYSNLISGATYKGLAHKKMGKPNQDYTLIKHNAWLELICVADGVGSHKYSHKGAKQICKCVYAAFKALKKDKIKDEQLFEYINILFSKKLKDKYKNKTATTCIFSGIYKETLYVAQAGDGICGIVFDGKLKTLGQRNSDFVNEVNPIRADSNNEGKWNSRIIDLNKYLSLDIFMATDGISDDILPEKLSEFISYIFEHVEMLDSKKRNKYILNILRNWSTPNSHDDKTIAILRWRQYENNR
jgi:serine/threonine protein phosphatase PrpC